MAKGKNYLSGGFGGMPQRRQGGGGGQMDMMRQAQKMQEEMMRAQEELETQTYESAAGGGIVRAVVSGKKELVTLEIDPEAVDPDDVEMLQDLVVAAVNEALRMSEAAASERMGALTGGLNLGGLGF